MFIMACVYGIFLCVELARADAIPVEPPINELISWRAHCSLGVILTYAIDGMLVSFAHGVKSQGGVAQGNPARRIKNTIVLYEREGGGPWRYIVDGEASLYQRHPDMRWESAINKTWGANGSR